MAALFVQSLKNHPSRWRWNLRTKANICVALNIRTAVRSFISRGSLNGLHTLRKQLCRNICSAGLGTAPSGLEQLCADFCRVSGPTGRGSRAGYKLHCWKCAKGCDWLSDECSPPIGPENFDY